MRFSSARRNEEAVFCVNVPTESKWRFINLWLWFIWCVNNHTSLSEILTNLQHVRADVCFVSASSAVEWWDHNGAADTQLYSRAFLPGSLAAELADWQDMNCVAGFRFPSATLSLPHLPDSLLNLHMFLPNNYQYLFSWEKRPEQEAVISYSLIRYKSLLRWYISINIMFLDIIHRLVFI
jgi:hypothetical protein